VTEATIIGQFQEIRTATLVFSKSAAQNERRKHFDKTLRAELVASVERHGIVQPIVVRPNGTTGEFEVIAGERRVLAAREVGLQNIPAMVHDYTDDQALDVQLIENLQREGLHPLVECEGYQDLKSRGHTVEQIAAKVGRSTSYVYKRLELAACQSAVRKAFFNDNIDAAKALLLSRLPTDELQAKALKDILGLYGEPMSYRRAVDHVGRMYMQRLDEAPFKTTDALLVPAAGACTTCPKNTAAQVELFGNVSKSDARCTDGKCFQEKTVAATAIVVRESKAAGREVLEGKKAVQALAGRSEKYSRPNYCAKGDAHYRSYEKLLGRSLDKVTTVAVDPKDGRSVELVDVEAAAKLMKEKGIKLSAPRSNTPKESAAEKARRDKEKAEIRFTAAVVKAIHEKAPKPLTSDELATILDILVNSGHGLFDVLDHVFGGGKTPDPLKLKPHGVLRAIRTYLLAEHAAEGDGKLILAAAKRHGVNVDRIRSDLAAPKPGDQPAAEKAKAATKKK
jgi:ParB/RepB/Spo0J family partition protein